MLLLQLFHPNLWRSFFQWCRVGLENGPVLLGNVSRFVEAWWNNVDPLPGRSILVDAWSSSTRRNHRQNISREDMLRTGNIFEEIPNRSFFLDFVNYCQGVCFSTPKTWWPSSWGSWLATTPTRFLCYFSSFTPSRVEQPPSHTSSMTLRCGNY